MFKRLAWLLMATMLVTATSVYAQTAPHLHSVPKSPEGERFASPADVEGNIVKILRTTNKAQTNSYVPVVFTFRNVNPFSVIRFLRRPVQLEEGTLFTFVSPEGNGGRVLFIVPPYMIESLSKLVGSLDRPGLTSASGELRVYRQLKHRRASETDFDFIASAASFSTGNGSTLLVDPETNALFFEDAPSGAQALDAALTDWYDVPTAMVMMVVKLYELDAYNDGTLGLDYTAWKNTLGQDLFAIGAFSERGRTSLQDGIWEPLGTGANGVPGRSFSASGYNYAYNYTVTSAFFDYLVTKGKARVLNKVKVAALNTQSASVAAVDQVLYYAVQVARTETNTIVADGIRETGDPFEENDTRTVVGTTQQRDPEGNLVPVETGIALNITPVIAEQTINFTMDVTWSDYNGFDSSGFPQINDRSLSSKFRMGVNDEIIVGGLNRQVRVAGTRKAPILGSLPIIGYAFGGETQQNKNTEVVVAIRPESIFTYDVAKDYKIDASDKLTIDQATGAEELEEPASTWGFDQVLIDNSRQVKVNEME